MTPKEKAEELYSKLHFALPSYADEGQQEHEAAKKCAIISAEEVLKYSIAHGFIGLSEYYQEVIEEIKKL